MPLLSILREIAWYSFLILCCVALTAAIIAGMAWVWSRYAQRMYDRASQDVRRNLGGEIDLCMAYVRDTDSPKVLMMALTRILEGNAVLNGSELKAEMDSLRHKVCERRG